MRTALYLIIVPFSLLFFSTCSLPIAIAIDASSGVDPAVIESVMDLPDGYVHSEDGNRPVTYTVTIEERDWTNRIAFDSGPRVIRRVWYAPVVSLTEVADTIPKIERLSTIRLPNRGISVDGLYPEDDGYPLYRETIVSITDKDGNPAEDAALLEWVESLPTDIAAPDIVWIAGVGDLMPGRGVERLLEAEDGLDRVFTDTLPLLQTADVLLGNLEGAVTVRGTRAEKSYNFRFSPRILKTLGAAGFDYLSLTNNHTFDFGEIGFTDTLKHFSDIGMATSGVGQDPVSASTPSVFRIGETEVRVLSVGAYPDERNGFDGKAATSVNEDRPGILWTGASAFEAVSAAFSPNSFDILMIHGGEEWSLRPSTELRDLFRKYIDLGADLILGSHPHVLHGLEAYRGNLIAYSLGNFIFPGMEETQYGEESLILRLGIFENAVRYVDLSPVQIDGRTLSLDQSGRILKRVTEQTRMLNSGS